MERAKREALFKEAKEKRDFAAQLYEGWLMNREDEYMHKLRDDLEMLRLKEAEAKKIALLNAENKKRREREYLD